MQRGRRQGAAAGGGGRGGGMCVKYEEILACVGASLSLIYDDQEQNTRNSRMILVRISVVMRLFKITGNSNEKVRVN